MQDETATTRNRLRSCLVATVAIAFIAVMGKIATPVARAQVPNPVFDVVSIKPNTSGDTRVTNTVQPGGRYTATNITLRQLIRDAYRVQEFQIVGGPGWTNSDRFDIVAKAEGNPSVGQMDAYAADVTDGSIQSCDAYRNARDAGLCTDRQTSRHTWTETAAVQ